METSLERAWQLYRFRRYALALEETVKFLGQYPESAEAFCLAALIHGKEKREKQALEAAEAAIRFMPDWSYPHYVHALVNYWFDKYVPSLKSLSEALRLHPDDADYYELVSAIHAVQGHLKTSLQMAEKGLECNAQHIGCLYRRGVALFDLKQVKEAEVVFRSILVIDADHAPSQGFIGHFLVLVGRYREALPLVRTALRDNPDWPQLQKDWVEALRGQYPFYGMIGRLRQWIIETHRWRCAAVVFLVVNLVLYIFAPEKSRNFPEFLGIAVILGTLGTVVILLALVLLLSCYLGVVSRLIFLLDADIRRTFSWSNYWGKGKSEGRKFFYGILIFIAISLLLRLFRKD